MVKDFGFLQQRLGQKRERSKSFVAKTMKFNFQSNFAYILFFSEQLSS